MKVKNLLLISMIAFSAVTISAQTVGDNTFLQSDYVEVGINKGGVYVSDANAPETYHSQILVTTTWFIDSSTIDTVTYTYDYEWWSYHDSCACYMIDSVTTETYTYVTWEYLIDSSTIDTITYTYDYEWWSYHDSCACWLVDSVTEESYTYVYFEYVTASDTLPSPLGMIYDSDMDGWDAGDPTEFWGDVSLPGSPEEGFGLEIDGNSYYNASQYLWLNDVDGDFTGYDDTGDTTRATWEGDVAGVHVKQETLVPDGKLYFYTRLTLTNTTGSDLSNVYYLRNVDPDQEQPWSWDFVTDNVVIYNNPADAQCLVSAEGNSIGGNYAMYGTRDERGRVSYGAFFTSDANPVSDAWNGVSPFNASGDQVGDIAIQVSFKVDELLASESATFTFAYIFSADSAVIEEAMEGTKMIPVIEECLAATYFVASDITETTANISWTAGSADYLVEWRKVSTADWTGVVTTDVNHVIEGLEACTYYNYRVTTLCGDMITSDAGTFKTVCATAIEDVAVLSTNIYPNPTTDNFTITIAQPAVTDATITIADALGRVIYEKTVSGNNTYTENISLPNIASGIYTVKIVSGNNTSSTNLVIE